MAYQKLQGGESPRAIAIIFIKTSDAGCDIFPAQELAQQAELEHHEVYQHEYICSWRIPEECVVDRVNLQTLHDRSFDLRTMINLNPRSFSNTSALRISIQNYWRNKSCFDRGYKWTKAAAAFGLNAPWQILADEMVSWTFSQGMRCDPIDLYEGTVSAKRAVSNDESLLIDLEVQLLIEDYEHRKIVENIERTFDDNVPELLRRLEEEQEFYTVARQGIENIVSSIVSAIGS